MRITTIIISILFMSMIGGCSFKIPSSKYVVYNKNILKNKKTKLLVKRFVEYWDARVREDAKKSWEYELPYQRYLTNFHAYQKLLSGYEDSKIVLKKIEFQNKNIALIYREVIFPDKKKIDKKDKWFFVKDTWYHKFYQSALPPKTAEEAEFQ